MSDLVFIAFASEEKAEEVRKKILGMQKEILSNWATLLSP
jgi:uncharacterized membrane protein